MDDGCPVGMYDNTSEFEKFTWWYAYHATDEEKAAYKTAQAERLKKYEERVAELKERLYAGDNLSWEEKEVLFIYDCNKKFSAMSGSDFFLFLKSLKFKQQ